MKIISNTCQSQPISPARTLEISGITLKGRTKKPPAGPTKIRKKAGLLARPLK